MRVDVDACVWVWLFEVSLYWGGCVGVTVCVCGHDCLLAWQYVWLWPWMEGCLCGRGCMCGCVCVAVCGGVGVLVGVWV